jgi:hypothetical protein
MKVSRPKVPQPSPDLAEQAGRRTAGPNGRPAADRQSVDEANAKFELEMAEARKLAQSHVFGGAGGGTRAVRLERRRDRNGLLVWSIAFRLGPKMLFPMNEKVAQATFSIQSMSEAVTKYKELLQSASLVPRTTDCIDWAQLIESCFNASRATNS